MSDTIKDIIDAFKSPAPWMSWVAISALLSVAGPFGTYNELGFWLRVAYWTGTVGGAILFGVVMRVVVQRWLAHHSYVVAASLASVLSMLFLSFPIQAFTRMIARDSSHQVPSLGEMMWIILLVAVAISTFRYFLSEQGNTREFASVGPPEPRILKRLSSEVQGDLVRMSVDDHYVDVVTAKGNERLLMRFSDALAELDGAKGARVHRSHWVALDAVEAVERGTSGKVMLMTCDGARVPVSRGYQGEAQQAGLI